METEIPISSTETQNVRPDMRTRSSQTSGLRDELSHLSSVPTFFIVETAVAAQILKNYQDRVL